MPSAPSSPPAATLALLALVLPAAALAGCSTDGGPAPPAPAPVGEGAARPPETFTAHGTTVAAFDSNPLVFSSTFPRIDFAVTANVTAVLVELAWDDGVQDLDAFARAPVDPCPYDGADVAACTVEYGAGAYDFAEVRARGGMPGAPDNPSRVLALREDLQGILELCGDPCGFSSYPRAGQHARATADVEWWNYVTVFYGPVPDGFTAIPPSP